MHKSAPKSYACQFKGSINQVRRVFVHFAQRLVSNGWRGM